MYKRSEIVLIPVPFSDLSYTKKRPVLVVSNTTHNFASPDIIVVAITSNLLQKGIIIDSDDLTVGILPKKSMIRCDKIYTLEQSIVVKRFGVLSDTVMTKVINEINSLITE
ncbi:MAG: type II toxin-antitoxin system PemK/MazF family toxin [Spirochaetaceae bacterium]|jgi:mRNA interferase MazF|nr:type II toxin-antitoxin system PemK/MazF family toxin [Spirochaetaceae bacterium]